jgi:glucose/mannose transport system substrate-binding protein
MKLSKLMATSALVGGLALFSAATYAAEEVEVLHWWTSGGEASALNVLKQDLEKAGVGWQDMPVAGGGGEQAMTALRARVTAGNPPTAVQMLGFDITDWAKQGVVADLNDLAAKEGWDAVVPPALQAFSKYDGKWIAAPVNVHSTNWVWANKAIFDKLGLKQPTTWDELIAALDKIKEAGYTAVAHGGQPWQEATIFDAVVMSTGGPEFYKKAFIDLDSSALNSDTMVQAFDRMAKLRTYVDDNFSGRDWNLASAMVIKGDAAMQIMGDWAKGEWINAGKVPGTDVLCFRYPGTQGSVTFNSDSFGMMKVSEAEEDAQFKLAAAIMDPAFQESFNLKKGSIPARNDIPDTNFDACGKKAIADAKEATAAGSLMGSMAHGHAAPEAVKGAVYDVVTEFFNSDMSSADASKKLAEAVANAK